MSLFNSFRRSGKQYAAENSVKAQPEKEEGTKEHAQATAASVEMNQKGEAIVRCDPAKILGGMDSSIRAGRQSRGRRHESMPSALSMVNTIPAGTIGPDMSKTTLTRTGNMIDDQATFSPLQGSTRIQTTRLAQTTAQMSVLAHQPSYRRSMVNTVAGARSVPGDKGTLMSQTQGSTKLLSELGNLSMDMHSHWLDTFSVCPVPSLVISTAEVEPEVLLVNTASVTALGRDSCTLGTKTLSDLIGADKSISCAKACRSGFEFRVEECTVQVGCSMQCSALFIPISDVCTSGMPQCYLVLLLDSFAAPLCGRALEGVPAHDVVTQAGTTGTKSEWRKGLFSVGDQGATRENYNQAVGIVSGYAEAAQRRLNGASLGNSMPSQFDVCGWISHFENLLTLVTTP